jgi:hypothetical protein
MPYNLIRLLQSSGKAGKPGETFRHDVKRESNELRLPDGVKMTDYKITQMQSIIPPLGSLPVPEYTIGPIEYFRFDNVFSRNARAYLIQNNYPSAYVFWLTNRVGGGLGDTEIRFTEFAAVATSGEAIGAMHEVTMEVKAPVAGLAVVQGTGRLNEWVTPEPTDLQPWPVIFWASVQTQDGGGTYSATLNMEYRPDWALFNPKLNNYPGWGFTQQLRDYTVSDLEFEWYTSGTITDGSYSGTRIYKGHEFEAFNVDGAPYPTDPGGLLAGETARLWLQWRVKGWTNWQLKGEIVFTRPGNET